MAPEMTRTAKALRRRIVDAGFDLPEYVCIQRCYHGRHQRAAGGWSWELADSHGALGIGSTHTATECASGPVIIDRDHWTRDVHIWPAHLG